MSYTNHDGTIPWVHVDGVEVQEVGPMAWLLATGQALPCEEMDRAFAATEPGGL